jgi:hypothetical protein
MSYQVNIDFKNGPSLGLTIYAQDAETAKQAAKIEAPLYGFDAPIKNVTVRPV